MSRVADHLSISDLEQRFRAASIRSRLAISRRSVFLAQGRTMGATSKTHAVTAFKTRWVEQLLERCNASWPDALAIGRRRNGLSRAPETC